MSQWAQPYRQSKPSFQPRPAQARAIAKVVERNSRIFLRPGQGKTAAALAAFLQLRAQGKVDCMLVLAPLRVITISWPNQLDHWEEFKHLSYKVIHGAGAKNAAKARRDAMSIPADVYLMNVEGLLNHEWRLTKSNATFGKTAPAQVALEFLKGKRVMLVVDESTMFKDPSTKRFKTLKAYLHYFARTIILTGSPRPGKLEDLWSQCYITDRGADLGGFITHFRNAYMQPSPDGFGYIEQPTAAARVAAKIAPSTIEIEPDEEVPLLPADVLVPVGYLVMEQYNKLRQDFIASIQGHTVMAPHSGVLFGKLRQIAQGALYVNPDKEWIPIHEGKLDALENLLAELNGEPAFCLYEYGHDWQRINQRLGYEVPRIGGGTTASQGRQYAEDFSAGRIPLLLGHPKSVARGVDGLQQNCRNVIWFAQTPSWEENYQANLRIARPGTKATSVTVYRIKADLGIEQALQQIVTSKDDKQADFLSTLRKLV